MCSSVGPGRSQQLRILPSLNSKEFFSGPLTLFDWRNYSRPVGVRLFIVVMIMYCIL